MVCRRAESRPTPSYSGVMRILWVSLLLIPLLGTSACTTSESTTGSDAASWMIAMNGDFTTETMDDKTYLLIDTPSDTKLFTERPVRSVLPVAPETVVAMWPMFGFTEVPPNSAVMITGESPEILTFSNPAWTTNGAIRFEILNNDSININGQGSVVVDASNPVNSQVTDAVTQTNTKVLGDSSAQAMGSLYQSIGNSLAMAAKNATNAQQQQLTLQTAPNVQGVMQILNMTGGQGNPGAGTPTN